MRLPLVVEAMLRLSFPLSGMASPPLWPCLSLSVFFSLPLSLSCPSLSHTKKEKKKKKKKGKTKIN